MHEPNTEHGENIWAVLDDRAGNRAQVLGVAARLGAPVREIAVRYGPFAAVPNVLLGASVAGLDGPSRAALKAPWPDLVIAAGRRTAPVVRWIKAQSGGQTRLVQIMDPGSGQGDFDLICRPAHDGGAPAPNILQIAAAPHRLTDDVLAAARGDWSDAVANVPAPRIAVLVGGSTRRRRFTDAMALQLCIIASRAARAHGGGLMVTTSRRTGGAVETIQAALDGPHLLHRWDSTSANPYLGFLAHADAVIVSGESVSMCSEACATGKPVYIYRPDGLIGAKHARLHTALFEGGYARPLDGEIALDWAPPRLDAGAEIAAEIASRGLLPIPA